MSTLINRRKISTLFIVVLGRRVNEFRLAALREMRRKPDRRYTLRIGRGTETPSVALKTRRII